MRAVNLNAKWQQQTFTECQGRGLRKTKGYGFKSGYQNCLVPLSALDLVEMVIS